MLNQSFPDPHDLEKRGFIFRSPKPEVGPEWREWTLTNWMEMLPAHGDSVVAVFNKDFIVIVPMKVDENDVRFYSQAQPRADKIPLWTFTSNKKKEQLPD